MRPSPTDPLPGLTNQLREAAHRRLRGEVQERLNRTAAERRRLINMASETRRPASPAPATPPPAQAGEIVPILATPQPSGRTHFILVGAGGNGARVVPPLVQMMRRGDSLSIIDDDIVEDRNLGRQHFSVRDIGQPKAAILAQRYLRDGLSTQAFVTRLTAENVASTINTICPRQEQRQHEAVVLIGCVDNNLARATIFAAMRHLAERGVLKVAWVDIGNETRSGQVILTVPRWPMTVVAGATRHPNLTNWIVPGMQVAMPQLMRPRPEEAAEAACGERIDLQTVNVNHLAAGAAINCLSWLILGIPIGSCGSFFSTLNTMQPIRLVSADAAQCMLLPDASWAMREGE